MAFTNKPFIWKNDGVTPPETLQNSGFIGGKKLPAPYVNAQWTATYKAIEELQQKAGEVKTVNNIQPDVNGNVLIPLPDVSKFYQKPTTGIPKTDLESSVQTALTKAESALQSVPLATAALDGLMAKGDKVSLDNVMSVFANLQKMKITNDDGSAIYTIGATLPSVKKGIFHATASTGTYAPPAPSVEGIIIAESASYWNFIGASDNGTWCVGTFQGSWKGWTTLATAKDVSNLSTRITALETSDTTHQADLVSHGIYGVATGTNALVMTDSKVTSYVDGMLVAFKNTTASTGATTLNINNLGAKAVVKANGTAVNNLKANAIYQLRYNGTNFILLGEGGEYGNVTASDVRSTKTFGTEDGVVQGTLNLSQLIPGNIKKGVTIDGVAGSLDVASLGGLNIAKGSSTSSSVTANYQYAGLTSTIPLYSVQVSGLSFTPKYIIVQGKASGGLGQTTIYVSDAIDSYYYGGTIKTFEHNEQSAQSYNYNLKPVSPAVIANGTFTLPLKLPNVYVSWIAIG